MDTYDKISAHAETEEERMASDRALERMIKYFEGRNVRIHHMMQACIGKGNMVNKVEKRLCPLMGGLIEEVVCFDISMVAEGLAPEFTAPDEIQKYPDYKDICLRCKNHRYD